MAPDHGIEPRTIGFSSGVTSLRDMSLAGAQARERPLLCQLSQPGAVGTSCTTRTCGLRIRKPALWIPAELTRFCSGAERGLRSPDARAFNAPLYLLSYLGHLIWRLVRESNPRLPARQADTLAAELTRHVGGGDRVRTCSLPLARRLLCRVLSYTPK